MVGGRVAVGLGVKVGVADGVGVPVAVAVKVGVRVGVVVAVGGIVGVRLGKVMGVMAVGTAAAAFPPVSVRQAASKSKRSRRDA